MINGNANGTRHKGERESRDDAKVGYSIFQTGKALAVDIEQQWHHTKCGDAGASGHYDAGRVSERDKKHF